MGRLSRLVEKRSHLGLILPLVVAAAWIVIVDPSRVLVTGFAPQPLPWMPGKLMDAALAVSPCFRPRQEGLSQTIAVPSSTRWISAHASKRTSLYGKARTSHEHRTRKIKLRLAVVGLSTLWMVRYVSPILAASIYAGAALYRPRAFVDVSSAAWQWGRNKLDRKLTSRSRKKASSLEPSISDTVTLLEQKVHSSRWSTKISKRLEAKLSRLQASSLSSHATIRLCVALLNDPVRTSDRVGETLLSAEYNKEGMASDSGAVAHIQRKVARRVALHLLRDTSLIYAAAAFFAANNDSREASRQIDRWNVETSRKLAQTTTTDGSVRNPHGWQNASNRVTVVSLILSVQRMVTAESCRIQSISDVERMLTDIAVDANDGDCMVQAMVTSARDISRDDLFERFPEMMIV
jgi:hypothetical protein